MKKIFTLLFAFAAAFAAQAQIEVTTEDGKAVANGETVTIHAEEMDWGGGLIMVEASPMAPYITNKSGAEGELEVTVSTSMVDYPHFSLCFGGNCTALGGTTVTKTLTVANDQKEGLQLHATFTSKEYKTVNANVSLKFNGVEVSNFKMQFIYNDASAGIDNVSGDAAAVKPVAGGLAYNFASPATRTVSFFAADGRRASATNVSGSGVLSTANLNAGIYLYNVTEAGKVTAKGKIIVK